MFAHLTMGVLRYEGKDGGRRWLVAAMRKDVNARSKGMDKALGDFLGLKARARAIEQVRSAIIGLGTGQKWS